MATRKRTGKKSGKKKAPAPFTFTPTGFMRWLKQHPPTAIVGIREAGDECPIARYLKAELGDEPHVSQDEIILFGVNFGILPDWIGAFVTRIDDSVNPERISALRAIEYLTLAVEEGGAKSTTLPTNMAQAHQMKGEDDENDEDAGSNDD